MKKFLALAVAILITVSCAVSAFAAEDKQRVFDQAGLLSESERQDLEEELRNTVDDIGMDFVILTTTDKGGETRRKYASDFYNNGGFGTDDAGSGLLLLIDMEDRKIYIDTKGDAIRYLTDERIDDITVNNDELFEYLSAGEYAEAAEEVIDGVENYVGQGIPDDQNNYVEATGETDYYEPENSLSWFEIVVAILVPAAVAYLYIRSIIRQYAMVAEKKNANQYRLAYRASSKFAFAVNTDELLHHTVTTRVIPRSSDSDHSSGSSGSSFSGRSTVFTSGDGSFHGGGGDSRSF